jgi:hypothetical protein
VSEAPDEKRARQDAAFLAALTEAHRISDPQFRVFAKAIVESESMVGKVEDVMDRVTAEVRRRFVGLRFGVRT